MRYSLLSLSVQLSLVVFVYDADGPRIVLTRYHEATVDDISAPLDREGFDLFQSWHHYCFVFSSYPSFQAGNLNLTNKIFLDGVFFREGHAAMSTACYIALQHAYNYVLHTCRYLYRLTLCILPLQKRVSSPREPSPRSQLVLPMFLAKS